MRHGFGQVFRASPIALWDSKYPQCPAVPYCKIEEEAVGHPEISHLLFYEY